MLTEARKEKTKHGDINHNTTHTMAFHVDFLVIF
jgi:hypothetical protein